MCAVRSPLLKGYRLRVPLQKENLNVSVNCRHCTETNISNSVRKYMYTMKCASSTWEHAHLLENVNTVANKQFSRNYFSSDMNPRPLLESLYQQNITPTRYFVEKAWIQKSLGYYGILHVHPSLVTKTILLAFFFTSLPSHPSVLFRRVLGRESAALLAEKTSYFNSGQRNLGVPNLCAIGLWIKTLQMLSIPGTLTTVWLSNKQWLNEII